MSKQCIIITINEQTEKELTPLYRLTLFTVSICAATCMPTNGL